MSQIKLSKSFCQVLKIYLITKRLAQIKIALVLKISTLYLFCIFLLKQNANMFFKTHCQVFVF